jgi:excisionase family DNA binding protein
VTERTLGTSEAAQALGVSARTVQRWLEENLFPNAYRLNPENPRSHVRIPEEDIEALKRKRQREGAPV